MKISKHLLVLSTLLLLLVLGIPTALAADNTTSKTEKTEPNTLTAKEKEEGFVLLFDGKTLSPELWQGAVDRFTIEDGAAVCKPGGNLLTKKEYADFVFRFQFKLPPGGNNGVGIRCAATGSHSHEDGMELQILDHFDKKYDGWLKEWQHHGSLYGVVPAKRFPEKNDYLKPVGQWNEEEVIVIGSKVKVILNGGTILDIDLNDYKGKPMLDEQPHKGIEREKGFVGFLGHGDPVAFRSIRIKEVVKDQP